MRSLIIPVYPASGRVSGSPRWETTKDGELPNSGYPCVELSEYQFKQGLRVLNTIIVDGNSYWNGVPDFVDKGKIPGNAVELVKGYFERYIEE